jgi:hypothetical protein
MAFAIKKSAPVHFPKAKPAKKADYLSFLHRLPCVVTGRRPVEAAHVSFKAPQFGAYGRGKGHKVSDRWALPVCSDAHADQHKHNEEDWWLNLGINPHLVALIIWGLWTEYGDEAETFATAVINQQLAARGALRERE